MADLELLKPYVKSAQSLCNKIDELIEQERSSLPDGIDLLIQSVVFVPEWQAAKGKYLAIGHLVNLSQVVNG